MRTFHVPLPDHMHAALRAEAHEQRRPATDLVRRAIESWLAQRRRERLAEEIRTYAEATAGTVWDLDPDLEAAAAAHLFAPESDR